MSVLQRFVLAERTLADLDRPDRYKAYFGRWCRREHEEEAALLSDAASLLPGCDAGAAWDVGPAAAEEPVHAGCPYAAATGAWEPADGHVAANGEPVPVGNSHVAATQKPVPADDARIAANGDYSLPSSRATESPRVRGFRAPAAAAAPRGTANPLPDHGRMAGRQPGRPYPGRPRRSPLKGWSTGWPPEAYRQSIRSAYEALRAQSASGRT